MLHTWRSRAFLYFPIAALTLAGLEISAQTQANTTLRDAAAEFEKHEAPGIPDISGKKAQADRAFATALLAHVQAIQSEKLSHEDWITLECLKWQLQDMIERARFYRLPFHITPYSTMHLANEALTTASFETPADLEKYLELLDGYAAFLKELQTHLREQMKRGIVLPKAEIEQVTAMLAAFAAEPEKSMFRAGDERLKTIPREDREKFQKAVAERIRAEVNPELKVLEAFVSGPYAKRAPEAVGVGQYPGGKDYYRYLVRYYTTMDVTPEQVHEAGLKRVEQLEAKMAEVRKSLGHGGAAGRAEFHGYLKTDPHMFPSQPEDIAVRMRNSVVQVSSRITFFFEKRPNVTYGIERLPAALEPSMTYGYASRHTYYYNGANLKERSLLLTEAIAYQELLPGHVFQRVLVEENKNLSAFRKRASYAGYSEGWGMYAAGLAREMGMYQEPISYYGLLALDMLMAVRSVVDTGMNYFGWSRERAEEYMREHTLESDAEIHSESLRDSAGQIGEAVSSLMANDELVELRERAKQALGVRFDIREFHQAILGSGEMPMTALEKHIDWYIGQVQARK